MSPNLKIKAISLREKAISEKLDQIKRSMNVDLCFVLDCTGSMSCHIAAAKDSIFQVSEYVRYMIPKNFGSVFVAIVIIVMVEVAFRSSTSPTRMRGSRPT